MLHNLSRTWSHSFEPLKNLLKQMEQKSLTIVSSEESVDATTVTQFIKSNNKFFVFSCIFCSFEIWSIAFYFFIIHPNQDCKISNHIFKKWSAKISLKNWQPNICFFFQKTKGPTTCTRASNHLLYCLTIGGGIDPSQCILLYSLN